MDVSGRIPRRRLLLSQKVEKVAATVWLRTLILTGLATSDLGLHLGVNRCDALSRTLLKRPCCEASLQGCSSIIPTPAP